MNGQSIRTFMAANTSRGFYSLFEDFLEDKTAYIVKGGPGSGKSTMMRRIASQSFRNGFFTEHIYCSSDTDSLDGVYIKDLDTAVCDGTAPHTLEPKYAGAAGGIINIGEAWDEQKLRAAKEDIILLSKKISDDYRAAYSFLSAAGSSLRVFSSYARIFFDFDKAHRFADKLVEKRINTAKKYTDETIRAKTHKRFLSAFSPKGYITFKDSVYVLADDVYVIKDRYNLAYIPLEYIYQSLINYDLDIYIFYDPLVPDRIAHLAVPELDFAIVTHNRDIDFKPIHTTSINISRFISEDIYTVANKLKLSQKIMRDCISEAIKLISHAKALHDDLEDIYISSMNFDKVAEISASAISKIFLQT